MSKAETPRMQQRTPRTHPIALIPGRKSIQIIAQHGRLQAVARMHANLMRAPGFNEHTCQRQRRYRRAHRQRFEATARSAAALRDALDALLDPSMGAASNGKLDQRRSIL